MCQECEICWDFIESSKSGASSLYLHNISKLKIKNKGSLRSPQNQLTLAKCFHFKNIPKCKKSSSLSKIVNNNAKLFMYTATIEAHLFAEKMNIYCTFTTAWHFATLWKKYPTQIFWKTFKDKSFVVLDIAWKLRIVTILLRWL